MLDRRRIMKKLTIKFYYLYVTTKVVFSDLKYLHHEKTNNEHEV